MYCFHHTLVVCTSFCLIKLAFDSIDKLGECTGCRADEISPEGFHRSWQTVSRVPHASAGSEQSLRPPSCNSFVFGDLPIGNLDDSSTHLINTHGMHDCVRRPFLCHVLLVSVPMSRENRLLITDRLKRSSLRNNRFKFKTLERCPIRFRGIYREVLDSMKKYRKMSTCNWLILETLGDLDGLYPKISLDTGLNWLVCSLKWAFIFPGINSILNKRSHVQSLRIL